MLIGYARVSTDDQNLALQISALNEIGCTKIYEDKISGTKTNRPGLQLALEVLRNGDTLVVWKLDRLGRTVKGLIDLINQLHQYACSVISGTLFQDTHKPLRLWFQAIWYIVNQKNGVSALGLQKDRKSVV